MTDEVHHVDGKRVRKYPKVGDNEKDLWTYMDFDITGDLPKDFDWRDMEVITKPI